MKKVDKGTQHFKRTDLVVCEAKAAADYSISGLEGLRGLQITGMTIATIRKVVGGLAEPGSLGGHVNRV